MSSSSGAEEVWLYDVPGWNLNPMVLRKLSLNENVDISTAWCKVPRSASPHTNGKAPGSGRILVIDHCGHEIYSRMPEDCCGCLRLGMIRLQCAGISAPIAVLRCWELLMVPGRDSPFGFCTRSVVVEVIRERDDDVGREIAKKVPDVQVVWDEWVQEMLIHLSYKRVRVGD